MVVAHLFHALVIFDRFCELSASMSRIACPCSDTVSAPTSIRNVCTFIFFPFGQRRCHRLFLSHSCSALLRLLLLVIHDLLIHHILNNRTNIQRIVTLMMNFSLNFASLQTRSYRDRWFHVSLGIAETQHSGPGKRSSAHRTRFSVGNSVIHECSTYTPCSRGNHENRSVS